MRVFHSLFCSGLILFQDELPDGDGDFDHSLFQEGGGDLLSQFLRYGIALIRRLSARLREGSRDRARCARTSASRWNMAGKFIRRPQA